jgi:hypothetical protein
LVHRVSSTPAAGVVAQLRWLQQPQRTRPRSRARKQIAGLAQPNAAAAILTLMETASRSSPMNGIIYLVGLVVVIMAILSFFGLR